MTKRTTSRRSPRALRSWPRSRAPCSIARAASDTAAPCATRRRSRAWWNSCAPVDEARARSRPHRGVSRLRLAAAAPGLGPQRVGARRVELMQCLERHMRPYVREAHSRRWDPDDAHAGRARGTHARWRVLERDTVFRRHIELSRRQPVDGWIGLRELDLVGGD